MFSVTGMEGFEMFNMEHIVVLLLFAATYMSIILFRRKIIIYKHLFKWFIIMTLIICEVSQHIWLVWTNQWEIADLPLHLCSLSTYIALYLFITNKKKAFYLLYFIGTIPPILAMLTPDMLYHFPHFRFIKYFLHHSVIPFAVLYFLLFEGYRVPRKAIFYSYVILNVIAVPVFFLNLLLDTNFFYLAEHAETETLLNFFGTGVMYYVNLELAAIVVFILTYIPMGILQKREKHLSIKK